MQHRVEIMIPEAELQARIAELGQVISRHYRDSPGLVLVGLLRGSCLFLADLCRAIELPLSLDFMTVASYGSGTESSRQVRLLKDLDDEIAGKDVLIVEDIIDTGHTLHRVRELLARRGPRSLAICTLLDKPSRREVEVPVEWIGFSIPDIFVVGCGLDYDQRYRNLRHICRLVPQA